MWEEDNLKGKNCDSKKYTWHLMELLIRFRWDNDICMKQLV